MSTMLRKLKKPLTTVGFQYLVLLSCIYISKQRSIYWMICLELTVGGHRTFEFCELAFYFLSGIVMSSLCGICVEPEWNWLFVLNSHRTNTAAALTACACYGDPTDSWYTLFHSVVIVDLVRYTTSLSKGLAGSASSATGATPLNSLSKISTEVALLKSSQGFNISSANKTGLSFFQQGS